MCVIVKMSNVVIRLDFTQWSLLMKKLLCSLLVSLAFVGFSRSDDHIRKMIQTTDDFKKESASIDAFTVPDEQKSSMREKLLTSLETKILKDKEKHITKLRQAVEGSSPFDLYHARSALAKMAEFLTHEELVQESFDLALRAREIVNERKEHLKEYSVLSSRLPVSGGLLLLAASLVCFTVRSLGFNAMTEREQRNYLAGGITSGLIGAYLLAKGWSIDTLETAAANAEKVLKNLKDHPDLSVAAPLEWSSPDVIIAI